MVLLGCSVAMLYTFTMLSVPESASKSVVADLVQAPLISIHKKTFLFLLNAF